MQGDENLPFTPLNFPIKDKRRQTAADQGRTFGKAIVRVLSQCRAFLKIHTKGEIN